MSGSEKSSLRRIRGKNVKLYFTSLYCIVKNKLYSKTNHIFGLLILSNGLLINFLTLSHRVRDSFLGDRSPYLFIIIYGNKFKRPLLERHFIGRPVGRIN